MVKDEMQYNLSEELEFSHKGEHEKTLTIFIEPPSHDCLDEVAHLSSYVTQAMMESQKYSSFAKGNLTEEQLKKMEKDSSEDAGLDAKSVKLILFGAGSVNVPDVIQEFKKILVKCGRVDEDEKCRFKKSLFERLTVEDIIGMMCEYIAVFIAPSLL